MKRILLVTGLLALLAAPVGAGTILIGGFNGTLDGPLGTWVNNDDPLANYLVTTATIGGTILAPTEGSGFFFAAFDGVWLRPGMIHSGDVLSFDYAATGDWADYWAITNLVAPLQSVNGAMSGVPGWHHVEVDLSSLVGTDTAAIFFYGGPVALDNVSLSGPERGAAVPEPATLSLLGLGLVGIARAARRNRK